MSVARGEIREKIRFSVAGDVGGIELLFADFWGFEVSNHFHDGYNISVSLHGGLAFDQNGSTQTAQSGVISAVEPCAVHNARGLDHHWGFLNFIVPLDVVRSLAAEISDSDHLPGFGHRIILDCDMARRLAHLHTLLESSGDSLARHSATVLTLTDFFRQHSTLRPDSPGPKDPGQSVQRTSEMLRERYGDRISLGELSRCAGLSPFHFLRVFLRKTGLTPHAYLNQIRVREAKRRLSAGMSCAQVSLECGFCDQSHLARVFKRSTGVTPGQYQSAYTVKAGGSAAISRGTR